jgi:hypothetical protein
MVSPEHQHIIVACSLRACAAMATLWAFGLSAPPEAAAQSQAFHCINDVDNPPIQQFTVPTNISEIMFLVQGAHGQNPEGDSGQGGFGGSVQATFAVGPQGPLKPGQSLDVWVGCHLGKAPRGYGNGGGKGVADDPFSSDGGPGGGGSAVIDRASQAPFIVAGGGGGGGGGSFADGGDGGNGGPVALPGNDGHSGTGGDGGCANCQASGEIDGLDGGGTSAKHMSGAGGGGGGGYTGGGGGEGGGFTGGGGGGGAGSPYVASSAAEATQTTSQLAMDGLVTITWFGSIRDPDLDGVPSPHDRCRRSVLDDTVVLGRCNSRATNDLDADGCTITDRIVRIAVRSDTRSEFLQRVRKVAGTLVLTDVITPRERRAIQRCAANANFAKLRR